MFVSNFNYLLKLSQMISNEHDDVLDFRLINYDIYFK